MLPENKSEMGGGDPDELDEMEMQAMKAGINNPDINRALGQGIRGQVPQSVLTSHQIVIGEGGDGKSKTANISDILGQVNKKSKSTKHQAQGHYGNQGFAMLVGGNEGNLAFGKKINQ